MTPASPLLIAEFARRCRLPISTLRYYDRVGLLRPAEVDPHSGYRRYSIDQIDEAVVIAGLRAAGSSLDTISRVLAGGDTRAAALASERQRLTDEIRDRTQALSNLNLLDRAAELAPESVQLVPIQVVALPFTSRANDLSASLVRRVTSLRSRLRRHHLTATCWGALLPLGLHEVVTGHVFAELGNGTRPSSDFEIVALPGGTGFRMVHDGPHHTLAHAYSRLLGTIDGKHRHPTTPVIERYPPSEQGLLRTEITVVAG